MSAGVEVPRAGTFKALGFRDSTMKVLGCGRPERWSPRLRSMPQLIAAHALPKTSSSLAMPVATSSFSLSKSRRARTESRNLRHDVMKKGIVPLGLVGPAERVQKNIWEVCFSWT